jgi:hypothetical protein
MHCPIGLNHFLFARVNASPNFSRCSALSRSVEAIENPASENRLTKFIEVTKVRVGRLEAIQAYFPIWVFVNSCG